MPAEWSAIQRKLVLRGASAGDHHEVFVAELVDGYVVDDAPVFTAHGRVAHLSRQQVEDVGHHQARKQSLCSWALDVHLAHAGQVLHACILTYVEMLLRGRCIGPGEKIVAATLDHAHCRAQVNVVERGSPFSHSVLQQDKV